MSFSLPALKPFCTRCCEFTGVEDAGDSSHPSCVVCHHRTIQMRGEIFDVPPPTFRDDQVPVSESVPDHARPAIAHRKLPAEKRQLTKLALLGYYVCQACEQISEARCPYCEELQVERRAEPFCLKCSDFVEPKCCLCGAQRLQWNPPVCEPNNSHESPTQESQPVPVSDPAPSQSSCSRPEI